MLCVVDLQRKIHLQTFFGLSTVKARRLKVSKHVTNTLHFILLLEGKSVFSYVIAYYLQITTTSHLADNHPGPVFVFFMVLFFLTYIILIFCNFLGAVKVVSNLQIGNVVSVLRTGGGWVNLG